MTDSERIHGVARDILGVGRGVSFRSVTILASQDRPMRIVAEMEIGSEIPGMPGFPEPEKVRQPLLIQVEKHGKAMKPKRKYTRRAEGALAKKEASPKMSTKDRLDPSRVFTISDDDLKLARVYLYNWRRVPGAITDDQLRALKPTEGIHAGKMSDVQKNQLLSIFNDVRRKRGLIK